MEKTETSIDVLNTLRRLIDDNGWKWGIACRYINRTFGTAYTVPEIKRIYIKMQEK